MGIILNVRVEDGLLVGGGDFPFAAIFNHVFNLILV